MSEKMISVVRPDQIQDTVETAAMVFKQIHASSPEVDKFNPEHYAKVWTDMISRNLGMIAKREAEGGLREAIGIMFFNDPATDERCACVTFWYVQDKAKGLEGGLLLNWVQESLRQAGIKRLAVASTIGSKFESMQETLIAFGFRPIEVTFSKTL